MTNLLTTLTMRVLGGDVPLVRPMISSMFAPRTAIASSSLLGLDTAVEYSQSLMSTSELGTVSRREGIRREPLAEIGITPLVSAEYANTGSWRLPRVQVREAIATSSPDLEERELSKEPFSLVTEDSNLLESWESDLETNLEAEEAIVSGMMVSPGQEIKSLAQGDRIEEKQDSSEISEIKDVRINELSPLSNEPLIPDSEASALKNEARQFPVPSPVSNSAENNPINQELTDLEFSTQTNYVSDIEESQSQIQPTELGEVSQIQPLAELDSSGTLQSDLTKQSPSPVAPSQSRQDSKESSDELDIMIDPGTDKQTETEQTTAASRDVTSALPQERPDTGQGSRVSYVPDAQQKQSQIQPAKLKQVTKIQPLAELDSSSTLHSDLRKPSPSPVAPSQSRQEATKGSEELDIMIDPSTYKQTETEQTTDNSRDVTSALPQEPSLSEQGSQASYVADTEKGQSQIQPAELGEVTQIQPLSKLDNSSTLPLNLTEPSPSPVAPSQSRQDSTGDSEELDTMIDPGTYKQTETEQTTAASRDVTSALPQERPDTGQGSRVSYVPDAQQKQSQIQPAKLKQVTKIQPLSEMDSSGTLPSNPREPSQSSVISTGAKQERQIIAQSSAVSSSEPQQQPQLLSKSLKQTAPLVRSQQAEISPLPSQKQQQEQTSPPQASQVRSPKPIRQVTRREAKFDQQQISSVIKPIIPGKKDLNVMPPVEAQDLSRTDSRGIKANQSDGRQSQRLSPPPPPKIEVTIGRLEVRIAKAKTPPPSPGKTQQKSPPLSLNDYLQQRQRGEL